MRLSKPVNHLVLTLLLPLFGLLASFASFGAHAQSLDPTLAEAQRLLKQGQLPQALAKTDAFIAGKPKDAQGRFLKGLILTEMKRNGEAIQVFKKLTEDFPELPEPYNNLAVLYAQEKQYEKARQALEAAIKTHPTYAVAHENLGDIYAKLASQAYGKALQIDAGNTAAQTKIAMIRDLVPPSTSTASTKPAGKTVNDPVRLATANQTTVSALPPQSATASPAPLPKPPTATPAANAAAPVTAAVTSAVVTPAAPIAKPAAAAPAVSVTPAASVPAPAGAKPATVAAAAKPVVAPTPEQEITKAIHDWTNAWSKKEVKTYLAFYAPDFQTPNGQPRKAWEQEREMKVGKPGKIEVSAEKLQVQLNGNDKATVKFRQNYRSANLNSSSGKTLMLARHNGRWLITQERLN